MCQASGQSLAVSSPSRPLLRLLLRHHRWFNGSKLRLSSEGFFPNIPQGFSALNKLPFPQPVGQHPSQLLAMEASPTWQLFFFFFFNEIPKLRRQQSLLVKLGMVIHTWATLVYSIFKQTKKYHPDGLER